MTPEIYLDSVRALLPTVRERAARAELLRHLPDETFADFQNAGLFRAFQPRRYGGYELDPGIFYQAVTEVGAVCGSSGWVLGVLGGFHLGVAAPDYVEHTIAELKALAPDVVIPMHCTGRNFIAKMRAEMPEQLVDWNTGSRFTFGV